MISDLPDVLTTNEAAREMRTSRKTVRRMVKRGELQGFRVGRQIRIFTASLPQMQAQPARLRSGRAASDRRVAA